MGVNEVNWLGIPKAIACTILRSCRQSTLFRARPAESPRQAYG